MPGTGPGRQAWADFRKPATRRLRSAARVATTTWPGSTPCSGIVVRSERMLPACSAAGMMATASPAAMYSSLSSMVSTAGPPGAGLPCRVRSSRRTPRLGFQLADLPAQGRLRDVQRGRGPAEVPMAGHRGEVPHQPQVKVGRRRARIGHGAMVCRCCRSRQIRTYLSCDDA
jgi:hypothetical protein